MTNIAGENGLKACPFCGSKVIQRCQPNPKFKQSWTECVSCGARVYGDIKNWNRRATPKAGENYLNWRGIEPDNVCKKCGGTGKYTYSSTATFMGGIGGQSLTVSVCDKCWGSGDEKEPWVNLRKIFKAGEVDREKMINIIADAIEDRSGSQGNAKIMAEEGKHLPDAIALALLKIKEGK